MSKVTPKEDDYKRLFKFTGLGLTMSANHENNWTLDRIAMQFNLKLIKDCRRTKTL